MPESLTPGQRLYQSWKSWQEAEARVQMAQQTLQGALHEAFEKNARFFGQVEFVAGGPCTWRIEGEEIVVDPPEPVKS